VKTVTINSSGISFADVIAIAREDAKVEISSEALNRMQVSRDQIEALAQG